MDKFRGLEDVWEKFIRIKMKAYNVLKMNEIQVLHKTIPHIYECQFTFFISTNLALNSRRLLLKNKVTKIKLKKSRSNIEILSQYIRNQDQNMHSQLA